VISTTLTLLLVVASACGRVQEADSEYEEALAQYKADEAEHKKQGESFDKKPPRKPYWQPSELYNGMIAPLIPYAIAGAVWYQGESNTDRPRVYEHLFKTLIDNWRVEWRQGALPFLFVQLANFADDNPEADWALLRESQAAALEMPQTGMAVTIDIGNPEDVHPRNKQDVGKRLWLAARKTVFNDEELVWSGPVYRDHARSGGKIAVTFEHTTGGLVAADDGAVKGFEIAGADRRFYPADARIEGNRIVVSGPEVAEPVAVRYGWSDNPAVNLYNAAGLPATPFRTDNW
jgi:sialate O-acetylesterase